MTIKKQPVYNRTKRELAANEEFPISAVGNMAALLASTGAMEIAFEDGAFIPLESGTSMSFETDEEFTNVRVRDVSGAPNTIDLYIGRGDFFDMRFQSVGTLTVIDARPDVFQANAAVAVGAGLNVSVLAANTKRKEAILTNNGAETVYIVHDAATDVKGIPLLAGATMGFQVTDDLRAYNPSGVSVDILPTYTEFSA